MAKQSLAARLFRWAIIKWYEPQGWTEERMIPVEKKFVVIAAPHTSNWDFLYFLALAEKLAIPLSFMGKKTLFRWPFAGLMKDLGGIPVDRSKSVNMVDQMIAEFKKRDTFMLTIAPEGTRGKVREWKTGFYHIAMGAGVPLVVGMMDYSSRSGGLGPAVWPTGDYKADMTKVAEIYAKVTPRHPAKGMTAIFASEDE